MNPDCIIFDDGDRLIVTTHPAHGSRITVHDASRPFAVLERVNANGRFTIKGRYATRDQARRALRCLK
jgi:hypothetical protein